MAVGFCPPLYMRTACTGVDGRKEGRYAALLPPVICPEALTRAQGDVAVRTTPL